MGGGLPPGLAGLMNDPEIVKLLSKPNVQKAFSAMMSGGPPDASLMSDPDVLKVMMKFQEKMGGSNPMGGMGGMGGSNPMGGMNAQASYDSSSDDDDDMPDLVGEQDFDEEVD